MSRTASHDAAVVRELWCCFGQITCRCPTNSTGALHGSYESSQRPRPCAGLRVNTRRLDRRHRRTSKWSQTSHSVNLCDGSTITMLMCGVRAVQFEARGSRLGVAEPCACHDVCVLGRAVRCWLCAAAHASTCLCPCVSHACAVSDRKARLMCHETSSSRGPKLALWIPL